MAHLTSDAANGVSFRELDADQKEAATYIDRAVGDGFYQGAQGVRLLKLLKDLALFWDNLARRETNLGPALQGALPGAPPNCPTAIQCIYDDVLRICNRLRPGGFRQFTDLASIATETLNRQADTGQAVLRYLETVVAALVANPLPYRIE